MKKALKSGNRANNVQHADRLRGKDDIYTLDRYINYKLSASAGLLTLFAPVSIVTW